MFAKIIEENITVTGSAYKIVKSDSAKLSLTIRTRKLNQKDFDIKSKPAHLIDGDLIIELLPEDTNIPLGEYYYDIQLTNVAEDVYTIMKGMLTIDWDVSD